MQISSDAISGWSDATARLVARQRKISTVNEESVEETDELGGTPISFRKQLTPEEEQRVLFLKDLLAQTLTMADGNPTDEQRERIRDIEKELEKITGVKMRSSLTAATKNLPKNRDDKDEDREKAYRLGIDPEEAKHKNAHRTGESDNPGMQMLRNNALLTTLSTMNLSGGVLAD